MPEETLTQKRQRVEREENAAREARRKQPRKPEAAAAPAGKGTFQMMPHKNRNVHDPSLRNKYKGGRGQRVESYTTRPGEAVKFSDQE